MQRYGYFSSDNNEYVVTSPVVEKPLENYIFNDRYFTCTFHTGNGFSKYVSAEGNSIQIIEGSKEPGFFTNNRLIYIKDEQTGECWNVGYYPLCKNTEKYECRHGLGYSVITNITNGIRASWRIFVPSGNEPIEIWTLNIENMCHDKRVLSIFAMSELSLKSTDPLYGHESYLSSKLLNRTNGVAARKVAMNLLHPYFGAIFISSGCLVSRDGKMDAFTGQFRTLANPVAIEKGMCSDSVSSRDNIGAVLHYRIELDKEGLHRNDFIAGAVNVYEIEDSAYQHHNKYFSDDGKTIDYSFNALIDKTKERLSKIQINTPDSMLNSVYNSWIPQLIEYGVTHCRWGTMGFRDIVQQAQGAAMIGSADKCSSRIRQALSHQYSNGYAVRSFPAVHSDSKMKYADSAFWIINAVTEYLKETGDIGFIDEMIQFLDGGNATVWQHLERALEALGRERGEHGLCLIYEGDWNDSMTHVGRNGRGESVMLSQSYCFACMLMEELADYLKKDDTSRKYHHEYEAMKQAINKYCWDGDWYIRAFDDHGNTIGSNINDEGKIFLNTQSWALISKIPSADRTEQMLRSINKFLYTSFGYALHYPTYTKINGNIGRLTCLEPGCSENASVYTHGNAFFALGLLKQEMADEAFDVIKKIMPYNPENPSGAVIPYQLANGYGGIDHRYEPGRAQYGWVTGSGSWMYMIMIDYVFGVRKTYEGIILQPLLPSLWGNASIKRTFRGCTYEINYTRDKGNGSGNKIIKMLINGTECDFNGYLPIRKGEILKIDVLIK